MPHRIHNTAAAAFLSLSLCSACASGQAVDDVVGNLDYERMIQDLSRLSHDSLEGRLTGSRGNEKARQYISGEFAAAGLRSYGDSFERTFSYAMDGETVTGVNVVGFVSGSSDSDLATVVSAHYDHLGIRDGAIFNGADDNASGTSMLLSLARYFGSNPPSHTIIFLAADAEEFGLRGARAFVDAPPVPRETIALNVNMDMVAHSDSVLFVAGTYHYPELLVPLQSVATKSSIALRFGHDSPDLPSGDDWTNASDHGPFHAKGIPFAYFGVEDHPDYHQPTDDFHTVNIPFFRGAAATVLDAVLEFDRRLEQINQR